MNDEGLMINHENGHSRPSYLAIKDKEILWFIPLSTKVDKYRTIIAKKEKKYGSCKTILIKRIAGREQAILIQNAFPTLEKYIQSRHTPYLSPFLISGADVRLVRQQNVPCHLRFEPCTVAHLYKLFHQQDRRFSAS